MNHNETLKVILCALSEDSLSYHQLVELVKITRGFAASYLKNYKRESIYFAANNGIDINDLVTDSISDIFEKDSDNQLYNLRKFIESLNQPIADIESKRIFLAFYSLVVRFVSIQIARIYADFDPNGARIHRNVQEAAKKLDYIDIVKSKQGTFFILKNSTGASSKNYFPYDEFERDFLSLTNGRSGTRGLLCLIFEHLKNQNIYRQEISLTDVVKLFKSFYRYEQKVVDEEEFTQLSSESKLMEATEVEQIVNKVVENIKHKIFIDYYTKGKVNEAQALGLVETINAILYDWITLGDNGRTNFEYLSKFINISKEEYQTAFKSKLEYLIDITKKQLLVYLEKQ